MSENNRLELLKKINETIANIKHFEKRLNEMNGYHENESFYLKMYTETYKKEFGQESFDREFEQELKRLRN